MTERRILKLSGKDAKDFLQGLITNDVNRIGNGLVYAAILTPQGKYICDFFLVELGDAILLDVADNGLPGDHHFFITFDTGHPDVEIADWLSDRYPGEMTVVMQHWFDNLEVAEDGFAVTLNFGDAPERLYIPFDAILTFVDPSVEFGLRFEGTEGWVGNEGWRKPLRAKADVVQTASI